MKEVLNYSYNEEQSVFKEEEYRLGESRLALSACTIAGTSLDGSIKPNEDTYAVRASNTHVVAAVFDGTSSLKPLPALGSETGAHFASHFLRDQFLHDKTFEAEKLLGRLNDQLGEASLKKGATYEDIVSLPVSSGTIITLTESSLSFAHVSDSFCLVEFANGTTQLVTNDRNKPFDDDALELLAKLAEKNAISRSKAVVLPEFQDYLAESFRNKLNNPNTQGVGAVNGDPHMATYMQTGTLSLDGVSSILLGTDGLIPVSLDVQRQRDQKTIFEMLQANGLFGLIKAKKESEDSDPEWSHIRFKHSDDATGVFIVISRS